MGNWEDLAWNKDVVGGRCGWGGDCGGDWVRVERVRRLVCSSRQGVEGAGQGWIRARRAWRTEGRSSWCWCRKGGGQCTLRGKFVGGGLNPGGWRAVGQIWTNDWRRLRSRFFCSSRQGVRSKGRSCRTISSGGVWQALEAVRGHQRSRAQTAPPSTPRFRLLLIDWSHRRALPPSLPFIFSTTSIIGGAIFYHIFCVVQTWSFLCVSGRLNTVVSLIRNF